MISEQELKLRHGEGYSIVADGISVDDRVHVLNYCDTFGIFDRLGDIVPGGKEVHGLYYKDTRFISKLQLLVNGSRPTLLNSTIEEENEVLSVDLTNSEIVRDGKRIPYGVVHIRRKQLVGEHMFHDKIEFENFDREPHDLSIALRLQSDFKDIFEVRGIPRKARGTVLGFEFPDDRKVRLTYKGLDEIERTAEVCFSQPYTGFNNDGTVVFDLTLRPREPVVLEYFILFSIAQSHTESMTDLFKSDGSTYSMQKFKLHFPAIETDNEQFNHWINRSRFDLISLMADTPYGKYPYAGVPWYNTAFGRDGIITALEVVWLVPDLARSVLQFLAANQSIDHNAASDAEPGKILHETRGGEMVNLNEVPFRQYYGSVDSTPLFVILAGEYFERTGDIVTIKSLWKNIELAVAWIDKYGDLDGDGFVEYKHKAENGLTNQGWKDSFDSVFHEDGRLAEPPIALCEVQGYVYMAKQKAARMAKHLGYTELASRWRKEAKQLKELFNEKFWDDQLECFVIGLDGKKRPCRVKTSNAGHVLFTGIASRGKALKVAKAMLAPDMFSGWGVRTVSSEAKNYNPMSYHNGSVWPHDVALIALGFSKYGMKEEVLRLMTGLFDASLFIPLQRLPELFCGFDRRKGEGPTSYPVACSPQAWSVAAVFILIKAILRIQIQPLKKRIVLKNPVMPAYLQQINIKGLPLQSTNTQLNLQISRHENDSMVGVDYKDLPGDWRLIIIK